VKFGARLFGKTLCKKEENTASGKDTEDEEPAYKQFLDSLIYSDFYNIKDSIPPLTSPKKLCHLAALLIGATLAVFIATAVYYGSVSTPQIDIVVSTEGYDECILVREITTSGSGGTAFMPIDQTGTVGYNYKANYSHAYYTTYDSCLAHFDSARTQFCALNLDSTQNTVHGVLRIDGDLGYGDIDVTGDYYISAADWATYCKLPFELYYCQKFQSLIPFQCTTYVQYDGVSILGMAFGNAQFLWSVLVGICAVVLYIAVSEPPAGAKKDAEMGKVAATGGDTTQEDGKAAVADEGGNAVVTD